MSTQQDIYAAGFESRPPMLNKENYVPWSSCLLRYAKNRPNGKLIHNSILNGPYVIKMIPEPGDANREITVTETFHLQIHDELSDKELKQIEADDQAIQIILLGLPEDIYVTVDREEGKLFNEWGRFTSNEEESIESYYHRFLKLMNDNKHFSKKIASNLKFLNNLQPEWSRHVTIVHQTKDLHTADYTQLYDFLKYNQKENGLIGVQGNGNQNQIGNGNLMAAKVKGWCLSSDTVIDCSEGRGRNPTSSRRQAQKKQRSLYDGKVLLEKHDPPVVHDSEETLQLAQESHETMKQLNKEIKPANYTKINHLSGVFVPQMALSREELYFLNNSKTANDSKSISIPNEDFSDDTTPSVARKFLNEVKSTIVTLQRVFKQRMTIETYNWSSSAHQELHKIVRDENFPIVNQVDARLQNFEIQFLKEATNFVGDFKSLANEADASLAKHKALELEIDHLLKAVVSQDIMIIVQNESVVDTSDL
nr:hypothetical protein [Tanacetum cinerariifolium]